VSPRTRADAPEATPATQPGPSRPDLQDLELLAPDDLCALLKVKKSWIYDEVEAGRLEALRLGKQLRFRPSEIARYLDERSRAGRAAQRD
jgi:excisionase family DNA binding protein